MPEVRDLVVDVGHEDATDNEEGRRNCPLAAHFNLITGLLTGVKLRDDANDMPLSRARTMLLLCVIQLFYTRFSSVLLLKLFRHRSLKGNGH